MRRPERLAETLREEITEIVGFELVDPRLLSVTVTDVRVSENMRDAKVFVVVEGSRQKWVPHPVAVKEWHVALFAETPLCEAEPILANAFAVNAVDYRWERGRRVRWKGGA